MREYFIEDNASGKIRITRAGREQFAERFARAGFDLRAIKTKKAFLAAWNSCFDTEMRNIAASTRGENDRLDEILDGLPGWD